MRPVTFACLLGVSALALPAPAPAVDYEPDLRFSRVFHGPGFNDYAQTAVEYQGRLVVAGAFTQFNGDLLGNIAAWDEPDWTSLDFPHLAGVAGLVEWQGKLYAGGNIPFPSSGSTYAMASYDGVQWSHHKLLSGYASQARAFAEYDGALLVGGDNLPPGAHGVALWNGSAFSSIGAPFNRGVYGLALYAGGAIAVGSFDAENDNGINGVARYEGGAWSALGNGVNGTARTAVVFEGDLVVGGQFADASGVPAANVARWDGAAWTALGEGLSPAAGSQVLGLAVFQGELYAVLGYSSVLTKVPNVRKWNGSAWETVGTGNPFGVFQRLYSLRVHDGRLLALGYGGVAAWDGAAWTEVGHPREGARPNDKVSQVIAYRGDLVVKGRFTRVGDLPANRIARWDGSAWHAMGEGWSQGGVMAVHDDRLYVAGTFGQNSKMGVWDGEAWSELDAGNAYGHVSDMASFRGDLVFAGDFESIGGVAAANIARWDGSAWYPLGDGMGGCDSPFEIDVHALAVKNDILFVGGTFTQAGGQAVGHVARWDGQGWAGLGSGGVEDPCTIQWLDDVSSTVAVLDLVPYDGGIVAGGHFSTVSGLASPLAAFWGPPWKGLAPNLEFSSWGSTIVDLEVHEGILYAVGGIPVEGTEFGTGIASWDGAQWVPLTPERILGEVSTLASVGDRLYLGGGFRELGGVRTEFLAAWSATPVAVRLAAFSATRTAGGAAVSWTLAEAGDGVAFHVHRGLPGARERVTAEPVSGGGDFSVADSAPPPGRTPYWLEEIARDGSRAWHGPAWLEAATPVNARLLARPNPFHDEVVVRFSLPHAGPAAVEVFDLGGRRVRDLGERREAGDHVLRWDGRDEAGRDLPAGVYFVTLRAGGETRVQRVVRTP